MSNIISKNKLTVLFVFHNSDFYSGATRSLLDIIDSYIINNKINIVALFPKKQGSAVDYLRKKNIPILFSYYTELVNSINQNLFWKVIVFPYRLARLFISMHRTYQLKEILYKLQIDIVYSNTSVIFVGGFINMFFNIPHIWHFREFRREDHQIEFFFGQKIFFDFANNYANRIIVISKSMFLKHAEKIYSEKMQVIYNDISPNYINPKINFDLEKQNLQLLITGVLCEGKGQLEVLYAFKVLRERGYCITLNIAGNVNCEYYKVLLDYVLEQHLQSDVIFHGSVKDMNELRKGMDIGIVASKCEALGRVTIEGMLSSLAMIGSDSAGTSELIIDGETGLLYKPNDIDDLISKIEYFYNNRSEIERIGEKSFNYAVDRFTVGNCSESILKVMYKMVKECNENIN